MSKDDIEEATKWVGGLDRIHRARGHPACYDLSATPFVPSGKKSSEEALFGWIVSDFGLNDAIESGLVKTPRVVVRDDALPDARDYKSRLYHIYRRRVKDDLNRKAEPHEPLPDLVDNGYYLLGQGLAGDGQKWWEQSGIRAAGDDHRRQPHRDRRARSSTPSTTAGFASTSCASPSGTLHIDSKVLEKAEAEEDAESAAMPRTATTTTATRTSGRRAG